jgi:hypothetical protein
MNWIKKSLSIGFVIIILNGCVGPIFGPLLVRSLGMVPDPNDGRIYLEKVDNNEFLKFILKHKELKDFKKENIIYLDNYSHSGNCSCKILFTKNLIYQIYAKGGQNHGKIELYDIENDFIFHRYQYVTKNTFLEARLEEDRLKIYRIYPNNTKWYQRSESYVSSFKYDRYSNTKRIKEIIDERVAYHRKQQLKER